MKNFLKEFKAFITKGNILDLAVGVIIGGAFNTIVSTLNKNILMPLINLALSNIPGMSSGLYTILPNSTVATDAQIAEGVTTVLGPDGLSYTVLNYIDWSSFFESILNFFLIALTLFVIVKVTAYLVKKNHELEEGIRKRIKKNKKGEVVEEEPASEPVLQEPVYTTTEKLLMDIKELLEKKDSKEE